MSGKLGTEFLDYLLVVGLLYALNHHKRMSVTLSEKVLCLMDLVGCVDSHKHSSDLGCSPECQKPCRDVCGPDSHMVARLHSKTYEGRCNTVNITPELPVSLCIIKCRVLECVLVRISLGHCVQNIAECGVNYLILLPREGAGP